MVGRRYAAVSKEQHAEGNSIATERANVIPPLSASGGRHLTEVKFETSLFGSASGVTVLDSPNFDRLERERSHLPVGPRCPVCGGAGQQYQAINLTACHNCGHIFQTDLNVTVAYDAEYAHQYDHRPVQKMSALRWQFIQRHLNLSAGSNILDVGYGNGAFLKHALSAGMNIFGIDVHTEDFGIPNVTFDTNFSFDLICFFDSLEHFTAFESIIKLRSRHVIVSIPNTPDFILTGPEAWRHFKPGEHLHYFSRRSLDLLLDGWGFPQKVADGFPEDELRGKLIVNRRQLDNIYTAIYTRREAPPA